MDTATVRTWITRFATVIDRRGGELSELDRLVGDGDYGTNLRSALRRATANLDSQATRSPSDVFTAVSEAFLHTGGTSGPLFGMWFREFATALRTGAATGTLADAATRGVAVVRRLGKAEVGHKTMVDAMEPAARALTAAAARGATVAEAMRDAASAAHEGAAGTADLIARRGRASYVGEHARGVVDPGALTVAVFFDCAREAVEPARTTDGKVIVTVAPTGGFLTRQDNPYVPVHPEEIAEDVHRCHNAGASMAALHARRADGLATCDAEVYRRINALVRERCDIVINNSTGGGVTGDMVRRLDNGLCEVDWAERLRGLDGGAETCTLDAITAYATGPEGEVLMNTPASRARELAEAMRARGIKPEWEAFNPAHLVQDMATLATAGFDTEPYLVNIVLGLHTVFQNAMPYAPKTLQHMVDLLPDRAIFTLSVSGPEQTRGLTHALLLGGHVRVGIEDNAEYRPGELRPNVDFVERIVRIIGELGLEPATPAEARAILGMKPTDTAGGQ
jgi:3-keto-5-aminohexanoate cleavage enzyme